LKLKCDEPLSNVAFNVNVRRYTKAVKQHTIPETGTVPKDFEDTRQQLTLGAATSGGAVALRPPLPSTPTTATTAEFDSQDTDGANTGSFASTEAMAMCVPEVDGAQTAASGGARTAIPPFILRCMHEIRDNIGRTDSRNKLPEPNT
jgi:hypothetical protein